MKRPDNPKLGTAYKLKDDCHGFKEGEVVYFLHDNGSPEPYFSSNKQMTWENRPQSKEIGYAEWHWLDWSHLEPLDHPPLKEAKYKIRVNPEQSRQIQEICFQAGVGWMGDGKTYHCEDIFHARYGSLLLITGGVISTCSTDDYFDTHTNQEISAQDFIRIYGAKRAFKVGDVVRVVKTREQKDTPLIGETGEIADITTSENVIDVRFYKKHGLDTSDRVDDYTYMLYKSDLELITPVEEKEPADITVDKQFVKGYERYLEDKKPETNCRYTITAVNSRGETGGALTPDSMRDAYQYLMHEPIKPVYVGWDFGITKITGKQPKKGIMSKLKNIPELLLAGLDPAKRNYYRLGWIATDSDLKLYVTGSGKDAFMVCQFLEGGDLPAYAASEVKRIEKEEKAAKKARRESEEE